MKKIIYLVFVLVFVLCSTVAFASKKEKSAGAEKLTVLAKTENSLTEEEMTRLTTRVEEIRNMDKSDFTFREKRELKTELREIKKNVEKAGGTVYIGGASLILLIILIILLV